MPLSKVLPATSPIGEPFARLIRPEGEADARLGLWARAIGRVHGARPLPGVVARFDASMGWDEGEYRSDAHTGAPISIEVSARTRFPESVFLHAAGQYLDQQHLGDGVTPASENDSLAKAIVLAARQAPSLAESIAFIEALERRVAEGTLAETEALVWDATARARHRRLLEDREVFARAYTQYVAEMMRPPAVRMQIARRMTEIQEAGAFPLFWGHGEFVPIARLLHELLLARGLIALRT